MKILLKQICGDWIIGNPVKVSTRISGQTLTKNGKYLLGTWAGPEQNASNLLHEICHLAEREEDKLLEFPLGGWGFSQGKYWEVGYHCGYEPTTDQQVMREARVWAYQLSLHKKYGLSDNPQEMVSSAIYLPAFCHFQFKFNKCSYNCKEENHLASEEFALKKLANLVDDWSRNFYTVDRFEEEWNKRMELLWK